MLKPAITIAAFSLILFSMSPKAHAQESTSLRNPLIPGASMSPPFVAPPEGQPEIPGNGPTGRPVTPGMGGMPGAKPWVTSIPANSIDQAISGIPLPVSPALASPPGILGPALTPFIPPPPSTPGPDPGEMLAPAGYINPAEQVNIYPGGGLPGTGGYYTTIPTQRRGGQQTHQWDLRGLNSVLGGGGDSQDEVTELGPTAGYGVPFGVPTGDNLRHSSIDLGGGMQFKAGGVVIPTGTAVQDFGLSSTRDNTIDALSAQQSTEFGQGWRRIPQYSSNTTDFGLPYMQFRQANLNPQKQDQGLLPTAIETNF